MFLWPFILANFLVCKNKIPQLKREVLTQDETFRTFHSMLLGSNIHVFTDHKNLTYNTLTMQHVLQWHLFIEDFHLLFIS